jgi:GH35 family endo-1,4-beta-xylanase
VDDAHATRLQQQQEDMKSRPRPKSANISATERRKQVLQRRETKLAEEQELILAQALEKQQRSEQRADEFTSVTKNREMKWLTIVNALARFDWIFKQVLDNRTFKEKNLVRYFYKSYNSQ